MQVERTRRQDLVHFRFNPEGVGKRSFRPGTIELNSLSVGSTTSESPLPQSKSLLHVKNILTGTYFLVDTGAEVSLLPPTGQDLTKRSS